ncbi:bifunctional protein HldE-like [Procambarus clarkii]|uniref:bifunctional protein HldE-like n=1 Tax=Procambarus clarkii TaxID=6728 RepID=UPI0037435DF6
MKTDFKILVLGDDCQDVYQYGTVDRISPEAPVPVFKNTYSETKPGMARNVVENFHIYGAHVDFMTSGCSIKTRMVDERSKQHILRIDEDANATPITLDVSILPNYDAVVISDYCKGAITYELVRKIRHAYSGPIFIDTKKPDLSCFSDCYVKVNSLEYENAKSVTLNTIVTLGAGGARFRDKVYPAPKTEVADVTGAGDTFLASLVWEYLQTRNIEKSIEYAIKAASISVQHFGVYKLTKEDVNAIKWGRK